MNEKQKAFCSKLYLLAVAGVGCEIFFNLCKKMNIMISVSKLVTAKINSNQRTAKPKKEGGKLGIEKVKYVSMIWLLWSFNILLILLFF